MLAIWSDLIGVHEGEDIDAFTQLGILDGAAEADPALRDAARRADAARCSYAVRLFHRAQEISATAPGEVLTKALLLNGFGSSLFFGGPGIDPRDELGDLESFEPSSAVDTGDVEALDVGSIRDCEGVAEARLVIYEAQMNEFVIVPPGDLTLAADPSHPFIKASRGKVEDLNGLLSTFACDPEEQADRMLEGLGRLEPRGFYPNFVLSAAVQEATASYVDGLGAAAMDGGFFLPADAAAGDPARLVISVTNKGSTGLFVERVSIGLGVGKASFSDNPVPPLGNGLVQKDVVLSAAVANADSLEVDFTARDSFGRLVSFSATVRRVRV